MPEKMPAVEQGVIGKIDRLPIGEVGPHFATADKEILAPSLNPKQGESAIGAFAPSWPDSQEVERLKKDLEPASKVLRQDCLTVLADEVNIIINANKASNQKAENIPGAAYEQRPDNTFDVSYVDKDGQAITKKVNYGHYLLAYRLIAEQAPEGQLKSDAGGAAEFTQNHLEVVADGKKPIELVKFEDALIDEAVTKGVARNETEFRSLPQLAQQAILETLKREHNIEYHLVGKPEVPAQPTEEDLLSETINQWADLAEKADGSLRQTSQQIIKKDLEAAKTQQEAARLQYQAFSFLAASEALGPGEIPEDLKQEWNNLSPAARNATRQARMGVKMITLNEAAPNSEVVLEIKNELGGEDLTVEETARQVGINLFDQACQKLGYTALSETQKTTLQTLKIDPAELASADPNQIDAVLAKGWRGAETQIDSDMVAEIRKRLQNQQVLGTMSRWLFGDINPDEQTRADFEKLFNKNILQKAAKLLSWPISDWKNGMCLATTLTMLFPNLIAGLISAEGAGNQLPS